MNKEYISKLSDFDLQKIAAYGGVEITPSMAVQELKERMDKKNNVFKTFENKFFIKKKEDSIELYKMGSYNLEEYGMRYDRLRIFTDNDEDWSEAAVQLSKNLLIIKQDLEWKFCNLVETSEDVYNKYLAKCQIAYDTIRTLLNE